MKTYLDCYPCFVHQALHAARGAHLDEEQQIAVVRNTLALLQTVPADLTPPEIGSRVHMLVRQFVGEVDCYRQEKQRSTQEALEMYPALKQLVAQSQDPFDTAVRLSIAGNIIDLAMKDEHDDLWATVDRVLSQPYAVDDLPALRKGLAAADWVLFLADNAGETVFDRVLVENLPLRVVYAVKGTPIVNDATLEDAIDAGLDGCAQLISNGSGAIGTVLNLASPEFRDFFERAPLIISKGQGNYETLSEAGERVFCLLQAKCPVIGRDIGVPVGSIVVRRSTTPA
jgi:uncharacterized protein with ATP-grasp and redox domains